MVSYLPTSLQKALYVRSNTGAIPYGGGTDLMVDAQSNTEYLFLHKVPQMRMITQDDQYIRIGAACTFTEAAQNPLCPAILRESILKIAAPAIRNMGTVGGNIGVLVGRYCLPGNNRKLIGMCRNRETPQAGGGKELRLLPVKVRQRIQSGYTYKTENN